MENRPSRPQRNRRHSRRAWPPEDDIHHPRLEKRLFTPEIKRMLKDWLIRRRENPYPSRDEKKRLAIETGLTYTQICNWFANWRRKLKNSEREKAKKSWGHLIKHYNTNARGNVEQFSISSEDSIWEEDENMEGRTDYDEDGFDDDEYEDFTDSGEMDLIGRKKSQRAIVEQKPKVRYLHTLHEPKFYMEAVKMEHNQYYKGAEISKEGSNATAQCYQISSTTSGYESPAGMEKQIVGYDYNNSNMMVFEGDQQSPVGYGKQPQESVQQSTDQQQTTLQTFLPNKAKYKQQMMEKYLRDTTECNGIYHGSKSAAKLTSVPSVACDVTGGGGTGDTELSKWLESAAKFTPNKNNYFIEWNRKRNKLEKKQRPKPLRGGVTVYPKKIQSPSQPQMQMPVLAQNQPHIYDTIHHKDELDAAEALANLAFNCRQRMLESTLYPTLPTTNAIPSS